MTKAIMSMRVIEAAEYTEKRNCIAYDYVAAVEERGFHAILVPNNTGLAQEYLQLDDVGMVILTGGNCVEGGANSEAEVSRDVYLERDRTERVLLSLAMEKEIPVLGICRGAQFINVYLGGRLTHEIRSHVGTHHSLLSPRKFLHGKIVNSYHNDGIDQRDLAEDLEPLAFSEDGFVEAFRHRSRRVVGILWHPERSSPQTDPGLLDEIMRAELALTVAAKKTEVRGPNGNESHHTCSR